MQLLWNAEMKLGHFEIVLIVWNTHFSGVLNWKLNPVYACHGLGEYI